MEAQSQAQTQTRNRSRSIQFSKPRDFFSEDPVAIEKFDPFQKVSPINSPSRPLPQSPNSPKNEAPVSPTTSRRRLRSMPSSLCPRPSKQLAIKSEIFLTELQYAKDLSIIVKVNAKDWKMIFNHYLKFFLSLSEIGFFE